MKRIAAFFFAFLAVCYLQIADGSAQFKPHECRYGFCVPGGGPSGNPISNACNTTVGTSITFTAQGTGTANANRISVVSINWSSAGSSALTAVSIGGIQMTQVVRGSGAAIGNNAEIWSAPNPTGTSSNIVLTASVALTGATIEVYSLIGYRSVVASTSGTTSVSQAYTNKQLAIAAGSRAVNVSTSLSNMTNDFSSACGAGLWGVHASQSLHGSGTLTSAINPTSNNPEIALAVWQQALSCTGATATLDGATANTTMSNGNLTATHSNSSDNSGARSTATKTTGKLYFELFRPNGIGLGQFDIGGLLLSTGTFTNFISDGTNLTGIYTFSGNIWSNNGFTGKNIPQKGGTTAPTYYYVAMDLTARKGWFRSHVTTITPYLSDWNNDPTANPATGVGGVTIAATGAFGPAVGFGGTGTAGGEVWTFNAGASVFDGILPSGFSCWPP